MQVKCKSEKICEQIQHPVRELKMEILVSIVNDFTL